MTFKSARRTVYTSPVALDVILSFRRAHFVLFAAVSEVSVCHVVLSCSIVAHRISYFDFC